MKNRVNYETDLLNRLIQEGVIEAVNEETVDLAERLVITSAVALSQEQLERIVRLVARQLVHPVRQLVTKVNSQLISGVRVQSESYYFEISGEKSLRDIKRLLRESLS